MVQLAPLLWTYKTTSSVRDTKNLLRAVFPGGGSRVSRDSRLPWGRAKSDRLGLLHSFSLLSRVFSISHVLSEYPLGAESRQT